MTSFLSAAWGVAAKDIRVELASRTAITTAAAFGVLTLVVLNFARDPTVVSLATIAPGALWVTAAFAGIVALNRSFSMELEQGGLDALLLAPVGRGAIYLGKYLANLAFVVVVDLIVLPVFVLFFNVAPTPALVGILGLLVLAAAGYVAVGTVLAAMTVRTRFAELMLPVLLLVFMVPPMLVGVQATTRLLGGRPMGEIVGWFWFLILYDVVFITLGLMLFPATVDE
ncbi:MAG: cytochrome C biogenesis protein [Gemmatimonadetes bacterium]|nr:cytochrome C biogenesis protein [Gemmatimonadota bacterium]